MGFLTLRDGSIEIVGNNKPEIADFKNVLLSLEREYEL
jgi:hypothetical protein